jgi:hypothetical protein
MYFCINSIIIIIIIIIIIALSLQHSKWTDMLHCELLLPPPAADFKDFPWLQRSCSRPGLVVASRDARPLCDKPFYEKQKFIRCSDCDIRVHCVCLRLGEVELAALTATGESLYKCTHGICQGTGFTQCG